MKFLAPPDGQQVGNCKAQASDQSVYVIARLVVVQVLFISLGRQQVPSLQVLVNQQDKILLLPMFLSNFTRLLHCPM